MDEKEALFLAICNPEKGKEADNTSRLVYADYLQENGEPVRAEFIRVQCQIDAVPLNGFDNSTKRSTLKKKRPGFWAYPLLQQQKNI